MNKSRIINQKETQHKKPQLLWLTEEILPDFGSMDKQQIRDSCNAYIADLRQRHGDFLMVRPIHPEDYEPKDPRDIAIQLGFKGEFIDIQAEVDEDEVE